MGSCFTFKVLIAFLASRVIVLAGFYFYVSPVSFGVPGLLPRAPGEGEFAWNTWRWLSGDAELALPLPTKGPTDTLVLRGYPVKDGLDVAVGVDGVPAGELTMKSGTHAYKIALPDSIVERCRKQGRRLPLTLRSQDITPFELTGGQSRDWRALAICIEELRYGAGIVEQVDLDDNQLAIRGAYDLEAHRQSLSFATFIRTIAVRWDSGWYLDIAKNGYRYDIARLGQHQNTAFYPLFSLLCRWVARLTAMPVDVVGLLLANIFALAGIVAFALLLQRQFSSEIALGGVLLLSFYPQSLFLTIPYTESLLLLLMSVVLILLQRGRLLAAAAVCGVSTACRGTAVALVPAILWCYFEKWPVRDWLKPRRLFAGGGLALVSLTGLLAYVAFLAWRFHEPLALAKAQTGWLGHAAHTSLQMVTFSWVWQKVAWSAVHQPLALLVDPRLWEYWGLLAAFAVLVISCRRLPAHWTLAGVVMLLIPYIFFGRMEVGLISTARYIGGNLPVFAGLAAVLAGKASRLGLAVVVGVFGAFLLENSILLAIGRYFVG